MPDFNTEFKKLNPRQKEAVETIDGPVLVIAGPGTGKTQLLSMRVANILHKTDTDPVRILCLTFTNKAAANMRARLLDLAGSLTRDIQVKTFHSFAAELINQYPDYFWKGARLQIAPEASQARIIQSILAGLPPDNPLGTRFAGRFTALKDVTDGLQLAKEAGLTPDKLKALTQANLEYIDKTEDTFADIVSPTLSAKKLPALQQAIAELPAQGLSGFTAPFEDLDKVMRESLERAIILDQESGKTKHTGEWKARFLQTSNGQKGMLKERERNEWWLRLSDVYEAYRQKMHERGHYDYADMLVEVLSQLDANPELLAEIQEHYEYLLIDEFQDSNAAQLRLAHLVADHHTAEGKPNIMAVGDDDQSIFGFNGAELGTMLFFDRSYREVKKIVLTENYRSSQEILDVSSKIIAEAEDRLIYHDKSLKKVLHAANPPPGKGIIEHLSYPTREHQLSAVSRNILKNYSADRSMAVLARNHESLRQLASLLLGLGVPIRYEQQNNILEYDAIRQVTLLAQLVVNIQRGNKTQVNMLLSEALRHPMWELPPEKLWQAALDNAHESDWLEYLRTSSEKDFKRVADWLLWLASIADSQPLPLLIEFLLGLREGSHLASPVRDYFASREAISNDYLHTLSGIRLLRELVTEFADTDFVRLKDFVDFVDVANVNKTSVTDESVFVTSDQAVELYTVHKAKGLEFDTVFIIDTIESNWRPRTSRRKPPANLPLERPGEHMDDYVRLLYVATTRAKQNLIIASYYQATSGEDLLPTPLLHSALPPRKILLNEAGKPITVLEETLRWPRLDQKDEKQLLKGHVENFSINVTNLLNFLDITKGGPSYFLERNLLRLPEAKTLPLSLGSAIHGTIEAAQNLANQDKFNMKAILKEYRKNLAKEHLQAQEEKRLIYQGETILNRLFSELKYELPKGSASEQKITNIRLNEAIIGGKLDRVDKASGYLAIVDYKTGTPLAGFESKAKDAQIKIWKHKTQLIFYALLARYQPGLSIYKQIEGQMVYLEAKSARQLVKTYVPSDEEIDRLERLIEAVWRKVKELDLPDTSKYSQDIDGILEFEKDLLDGKI